MALVDPNIAMSYRGIELPNQLAQYGQVQQIQAAQNQNRMADLQMQEAQAMMQERNALRQLDPNSPEYERQLFRINPKLGMEQRKEQATIRKTTAEAAASEAELQNKRLNWTWQAIGSSPTPDKAIANISKGLKDGVFSMQEASAATSHLQGMSPQDYAQYRMDMLMRTVAGKDQLEMLAPKIDRLDAGGSFIATQGNRFQPNYGQAMAGIAPIPKTATIGERTAQGNLSLAQQKFAFEQANPGITVQQTEDGTLVGVNNRTGQAMPITMGGAAPAAPAIALASNAFSPRLPPTAAPAVTQAIPGMPSVLDQRAPVAAAPAAPMAGTPLRGKGTAMTDTQHNAALFGGAMAQAQSTIQQIEKTGTNKSVAVVPGLLTGLANMVPFGAGEGIANAIDATFRADPTRLLGPDADQQRLAQAQLAFATAYLRKTSGAAFGASEVANTIKEFFPLRGEPDAVVQQKAASRERVVKGMSMGTTAEGRKHIEEAAGSNDPLGIRKPQ